jgi:hypothetical protein
MSQSGEGTAIRGQRFATLPARRVLQLGEANPSFGGSEVISISNSPSSLRAVGLSEPEAHLHVPTHPVDGICPRVLSEISHIIPCRARLESPTLHYIERLLSLPAVAGESFRSCFNRSQLLNHVDKSLAAVAGRRTSMAPPSPSP